MSKDHLSRKQLKTDELQKALAGAEEYISEHRDETKRWVAIGVSAIVLVALIWGGLAYRSSRLEKRFSDALGLLSAPLVTEGEKPAGNQPVFKSASERQAAVQKELESLVSDAPRSRAGKSAAMMLTAMGSAKDITPEKVSRIESLASSSSKTITGGLAAAAAIDLKAAEGKPKEAIELGRKYLEMTNPPLPKDIVLYMLAELYEKGGQVTEAKTFYQRVVNEYPRSVMKGEAQQRLTNL